MKSGLLSALLLASLLFTGAAYAQRATVPIIDHPNIPVATSKGGPVQAERVKQAITDAARAKNWTVAYEPSGRILATLVVRNKHTVTVEIEYSGEKYSIKYRDSVNMKHEGAMIHPFYNKWVGDLKDTIRVELLKA
jgi:hypothetical protein